MTSKILNSLPHLANDSVTKQVTDILSDLIVTGKIVEGDFLPTEEDLCYEFGIGRSSVREAIKTLESRGMVRKLHGKGGGSDRRECQGHNRNASYIAPDEENDGT